MPLPARVYLHKWRVSASGSDSDVYYRTTCAWLKQDFASKSVWCVGDSCALNWESYIKLRAYAACTAWLFAFWGATFCIQLIWVKHTQVVFKTLLSSIWFFCFAVSLLFNVSLCQAHRMTILHERLISFQQPLHYIYNFSNFVTRNTVSICLF